MYSMCRWVCWQVCIVLWWSGEWVWWGHSDCWLPRWHVRHRCMRLTNATFITALLLWLIPFWCHYDLFHWVYWIMSIKLLSWRKVFSFRDMKGLPMFMQCWHLSFLLYCLTFPLSLFIAICLFQWWDTVSWTSLWYFGSRTWLKLLWLSKMKKKASWITQKSFSCRSDK